MTLSNVETMHSVADISVKENKAMCLSPERNDDFKEYGEPSSSRCLQVKFNLNIVEEKEENGSKPSSKLLLGHSSRSLLSKYDWTEAKASSDLKINNCAKKRNSVSKKEELFCFRRTLKMLGFEPKDFGVSEGDNNSQLTNTLSPRSAPVLNTRLRERTVSLENLKTALQDIVTGAPSGEMNREMLARAAYEEWYFQKLEKAKKIKKIQTEKEKELEQKREKVILEQKKQAEENFKKWVTQKNTELRKKKQQKSSDSTGNKAPASEHKDAFIYWKKQKDEILKQKKLNEMKAVKKSESRENNMETEKRFQMWKKKTDEALKAKVLQEKRKETEREEKKRREEEERKQNAAAAFLAWKKAKDEQVRKEAARRKSLAERTLREKMERETERCYESEQAFEEWLDEIEERQKKPTQSIPIVKEPWSPGGSTNWLHSL